MAEDQDDREALRLRILDMERELATARQALARKELEHASRSLGARVPSPLSGPPGDLPPFVPPPRGITLRPRSLVLFLLVTAGVVFGVMRLSAPTGSDGPDPRDGPIPRGSVSARGSHSAPPLVPSGAPLDPALTQLRWPARVVESSGQSDLRKGERCEVVAYTRGPLDDRTLVSILVTCGGRLLHHQQKIAEAPGRTITAKMFAMAGRPLPFDYANVSTTGDLADAVVIEGASGTATIGPKGGPGSVTLRVSPPVPPIARPPRGR